MSAFSRSFSVFYLRFSLLKSLSSLDTSRSQVRISISEEVNRTSTSFHPGHDRDFPISLSHEKQISVLSVFSVKRHPLKQLYEIDSD